MRVLELFAGSRSIGKAAQELGYEVFSTDIEPFEGIDYVVDILDFDLEKLPWKPDIIWASPPCTTYSVAAIYRHRNGPEPKTEAAKLGDEIVKKTLQIISELNPKFYFIENPRGMLRKMPFMLFLPRTTVTYCQYGESRMKPTDIWHNSKWVGRQMCKPGADCHDRQPAGYWAKKDAGVLKLGTQGQGNAFNRSIIPHELCLEVLRSCKTT